MIWLALGVLFAKTYQLEGLVVEVDAQALTLTVSHKEIPGVMPAMLMPLRVKDGRDLAGVSRGAVIELQLVAGDKESYARRIRVRRVANEIEEDGRRVPLPVPKEKIAAGEPVTDFALTDQTGRSVRLSEFAGRVVVVQFLYTRCPMAEVCPRLAAAFGRLQRRFAGREDLMLLSITLDPRYDTVDVLSRYAAIWRAQSSRWRFLTGPEERIRAVAASFGMVYWPEEGVITHTSTIGIVGRDGRLKASVEGLSFTAKQLGDLVEHELGKEK